MLRRTTYRGPLFHLLSRERFEFFSDGSLVVDASGRVEAMGPWGDVSPPAGSALEVLPPGHLMIPGLMDLHVHLPQLSVTGCQEKDLLTWLERVVFPAEARFADPEHGEAMARWFFGELPRNGTTTAAVFLTSHRASTEVAFEVARDMGNRVIMGLNLMDRLAPDALLHPASEMLADTEALYHRWHGMDEGRISYAWMPRFAITSGEDLVAGIGVLRERYPDAYLHTHLSEQPGEIEEVLRLFPHCDTYTGVYDHYGLLGPRTILAHGIHLSDPELARIGEVEACLAHCPGSNFFLKSGRFRWLDVARRNLRFGLGSDVGGGPSLSMFQAMREAQYTQPESLISVTELFYAATLGAARAIMREDALGNLLPGKEADFLVLDLRAKPPLPEGFPQLGEDAVTRMLSRLIYLGDDRLVSRTFIRGREVYRRELPS